MFDDGLLHFLRKIWLLSKLHKAEKGLSFNFCGEKTKESPHCIAPDTYPQCSKWTSFVLQLKKTSNVFIQFWGQMKLPTFCTGTNHHFCNHWNQELWYPWGVEAPMTLKVLELFELCFSLTCQQKAVSLLQSGTALKFNELSASLISCRPDVLHRGPASADVQNEGDTDKTSTHC